MPKDLAALLVEEGAVPADVVERALARQREAGGALDTALLEARAMAEDALVARLARAAGLPAAPAVAWSAEDARARRVFPSRVAERHGLAPFALDGRELSLAAIHPVDVELLDEISFMLSLHLVAHVGPEWRVRELIHRLYGTPLAPRLAALSLAAGAAAPGEPLAGDGAAPAAQRAPGVPGFARDDEPLEPLAAALAQALESVDPAAGAAATGHEVAAPAPAPALEQAAPAIDARARAPELGTAAHESTEARGPEECAAADLPVAADRSAPPRWTLDEARAALAAARDRDEVVLATLRYARDFFELAAMFAVTRDAIAGHDALGPEEARERCRSVAIWATDPGAFKTAVETRSPHLGPFAPDAPGNEAILSALGRDPPRTALVYPVLLRDRPVCVLYAENGQAPVSHRRLGDLLLFLATVGGALERIIRGRKEQPQASSEQPPAATEVAAPPAAEPPREEPPPQVPANEPAANGPLAGPPREAALPFAPARLADTLDTLYEHFFSVTLDLSDLDEAEPTPSELADRALDADPTAAAAACEALAGRRRDPAIRPAIEKLRRALLSGISGRAIRGARAIAALRDAESIPLLIQVIEVSEPEVASAAADALSAITLQRLGPDARAWLGWWKENRGRGRAEWLFSGLTSLDRQTRVSASLELSVAAPPPVAYSADMPAAERASAARAWAGWWSRSGRVL